jgi:hypothetical protein
VRATYSTVIGWQRSHGGSTMRAVDHGAMGAALCEPWTILADFSGPWDCRTV